MAYILAVGVNEYANAQFNLQYALADAQDFAGEFAQKQQKLGRYSRVVTKMLTNQEATKANFLQALKEIAAQAQPEDGVIIYFAGHGTAQQSRFYLIPHDLGYTGGRDEIDAAGLQSMLAHSISDLELQSALENVDAGELLMVLDACNSGQALEAEEKRRGPMNSSGLAQLAYEKGMYILTAAQSYQAALEASRLGHGYLTYTLVDEGLRQGKADATPADGNISVREWFDYAVARVPQMQEERMATRQIGLKDVAFVQGQEKIADPRQRNLQRPRAFYRRETSNQTVIIARSKP